MAFTRRNTSADALYCRAWTCDTTADLTALEALIGNPGGPHRGDVAFVTANSTWYIWTDDNTFHAYAPVDLTANVSGVLPVANGGTGLASGTSGGVLGYTASGTLASSAALASTALVLGGGAGATPTTDSNWTINAQHTLNSSQQPRAIAWNSAVQSVASGAFTALTLDHDDVNVQSMHSTSVNTSRLTVPTGGAGFYLLVATTSFGISAAGSQRNVAIEKNGTTFLKLIAFIPSGSIGIQVQAQTCAVLADADYVEILAFQDSGGNMNVGNAARSGASELIAVKLW